ncbi:MAG: LacI family DNA-binding transcriptional regulator [Kiritimatiellia bacterium]|nr:LacI family DNA-binding transcriptional regulator [Kiritimatiellia bacterium]
MNIREISKFCGVSVCTTSRVLSGQSKPYRISAATANRVRKAAKKLGYRPNYLAHSLNTGRTHTVGLILANTVDSYLGSIMEGVEDRLRTTDYRMVVATCENSLELQDREIERMQYRQVDGIILYPKAIPINKSYRLPVPLNTACKVTPFVIVGRHLPGTYNEVMIADAKAGSAAAAYLADRGGTRFGVIAPAEDCSSTRARRRGFLRELKRRAIPKQRVFFWRTNRGLDERSAKLVAACDALFGINSGCLLKVLESLCPPANPQKFKLASFGLIKGQSLLNLDIRIWSLPGHHMGYLAAELLLQSIADPRQPIRHVELPVE